MFKLIVTCLGLMGMFFNVEGSSMTMPSFAFVGGSVNIICDIDLGRLLATSITFYKDDKEVYKCSREDGSNSFSVSTSSVTGVTLNMEKRDKPNELELMNVVEATSGVYSCKAKLDHPSMHSVTLSGTLKVIPAKN